MHDGALRADGDDDEIAVPGRELLERSEQLLALRAAGCAAHALLGFARRQVEPLEVFFGARLRLGCALARAVEDALRGSARFELGIRVDGACDLEQSLTPSRRLGIEQPLRTVEPAGGQARERRGLVGLEP